MKRQLHLLKEKNDLMAAGMIETLSRENPDLIEVVLLQEARETIPSWQSRTYRLYSGDEPPQSLSSGIEAIGYERLVDLIFEADSVVAW